MPKSKKPSNSAEEKKTVWRTPVKLPTIAAAVEPMKSLYMPGSGDAAPVEMQVEEIAAKPEPPPAQADRTREAKQAQEVDDLPLENTPPSVTEKPIAAASKRKANPAKAQPGSGDRAEAEDTIANLSEAEFLRLLRTEKMDFYSLAEILRGSSMALYCVLYSESLAKGESRCQIRQNELMMRVAINNPATLYKQERWLTALRLINKRVRPGNHNGASYEVRPLETLPLPKHILDQFGGYLAELVG